MLRLTLVIALSLAAGAASAQAAYQWKDANGVTHYSSTPPDKGTYQVRSVNDHGASMAASTAAQPAEKAEDPQCATARANLNLLGGKGAVTLDSDGDGKPDKTLSAEDRANQTALAEASLKANCGAPAAK